MGALSHFQQFDAFVHVGVVGRLETRDIPGAGILLIAPLSKHPIVELRRNLPVELVDVHGIDPVLEPPALFFQARNRLGVLALFVSTAFLERLAHPFENVVTKSKSLKVLLKLLEKHLFACIGFATFSLIPCAVIVDVFLLLDFSN